MIKRRILILLSALWISAAALAQQGRITGMVIDDITGEALIGANIVYEPGKGTVSDLEGKFELTVPRGAYTLQVSYVGYGTETRELQVSDRILVLEFRLKSLTIDEVVITADVARSRETPVAFTNITPARIEEELAGRDIPLILNTTPGVYATQQGGGDGDARITIRGFDQRNLAVMIDGIPVNDMENGWVYWSNWFGLDAVQRTMQVQRGLGASQLALPSVGGTINILTIGIESDMRTSVKQEVDSQGKIRTSFGFTSGKLPNGWGITLAGSYKRGNGWVDNTYSEGWFYYAKVDKRMHNHLLTLTAMGAPQMHDHRSYTRPISAYDTVYAKKLGIDIDELKEANPSYNIYGKGVQYNQHWGYLKRDRFNPDAEEEVLAERSNQYHKPQFTLRDFWTISDKLNVSNNLYLSIGKGGGDRPISSIKDSQLFHDPDDPHYGQINWQSIYNANCKPQPPFNTLPINPIYSDSLLVSSNYMTRQHNEHYWYGLLSKVNYNISSRFDISGGLDLRSYKGIHFTTVRDLLGGDYAVDKYDKRIDYVANLEAAMKFVGDTVDYYYDGLVRWGGVFVQGEYKTGKISTFLNLTTAVSGYNKIDYFNRAESGWIYKQGFTVKSGLNYNLTQHSNLFINLGYLSRVRAYRYFYRGYTTNFAEELDNELIKAIEAGYTYGSPVFSLFLNAYYTRWENKPTNRIYSTYNLQPGDPGYVPDDPESNSDKRVYADIPGMNARHMGVELDMVYKALHNLEIQGMASVGDWIWDSYVENLQFYLDEGNNPAVNKEVDFDARGIHVGDAAQVQIGSSVRYEPFKGFYMNVRQTYFTKYYSNFTPEATTDPEGNVHDSWQMPAFNLFDLHSGYHFRIKPVKKVRFDIRFSMLNLLNTKYIWDATNNDSYSPYSGFQTFDARSATVFFGLGRRFTVSLKMTF
ncbi:MAG: TonB-dependent receptor [Bacteroidales bacterium]|nr:TonB-dependent receptor [Bacteroidales bacterium]MBN2699586.1 TonB-dependent receptor [Bacteroidales bacterium]